MIAEILVTGQEILSGDVIDSNTAHISQVLEEVGIEVKNIRYFGSQPWPFPDSLMVAFTAEYAGGKIVIDKNEITDAGWFSADDLPGIPDKVSIARRLIDWFVANY